MIRGALDSTINLLIKDKTSVGLGSTHLEGGDCGVFFSLHFFNVSVCMCVFGDVCVRMLRHACGNQDNPQGLVLSCTRWVPGLSLLGSVAALPTEPSRRPARLFQHQL